MDLQFKNYDNGSLREYLHINLLSIIAKYVLYSNIQLKLNMAPRVWNQIARDKDTGFAPHVTPSCGTQKRCELCSVVKRCRQVREASLHRPQSVSNYMNIPPTPTQSQWYPNQLHWRNRMVIAFHQQLSKAILATSCISSITFSWEKLEKEKWAHSALERI